MERLLSMSFMKRIPVAGPHITQKEIDYVTDAVTNAWYNNANMYHGRFEKAFAEYLGVPFSVALPSCTSAIHLALLALGIGPGDEVIIPEITWIASSAPISYVGATPVFADIDAESWCISVQSIKENITPRTKAIIPVDLYGNMPAMNELLEIAQQHGIAVIEDAAEAIGSEYHQKKAGSFGDAGVFSFHGSKTLTTGEGGMLATGREDLYRRVLFLRDHGRQPGQKMFWNTEVAYKAKMSNMQAALGLAQLERIDELIHQKRQIFRWYQTELGHVSGIRLNAETNLVKNSYWMVTLLAEKHFQIAKEELIALMDEHNIDCRPFFYPLSSLPAYEELPSAALARQRNTTSYKLSPYGINLPCALTITREDVIYVCDVLKEILQSWQKK